MAEQTLELTKKDADIALKLFIVAKKWGQYMYEDDIKRGNAYGAVTSLSIVECADNFITRIKQWQDAYKTGKQETLSSELEAD